MHSLTHNIPKDKADPPFTGFTTRETGLPHRSCTNAEHMLGAFQGMEKRFFEQYMRVSILKTAFWLGRNYPSLHLLYDLNLPFLLLTMEAQGSTDCFTSIAGAAAFKIGMRVSARKYCSPSNEKIIIRICCA
jgi:hypothetical protein